MESDIAFDARLRHPLRAVPRGDRREQCADEFHPVAVQTAPMRRPRPARRRRHSWSAPAIPSTASSSPGRTRRTATRSTRPTRTTSCRESASPAIRIGDGKTILRGGYGLYYDQPLIGIFLQNTQVNPPFNATVSVTNPVLGNPAAGLPPSTRGALGGRGTSAPFTTPQTQQWNIGLQRQLYRRGAIDISYVGSRGDNLLRPVDINFPQPRMSWRSAPAP